MALGILLVGGPGSTKGTQGKALQTYLNADPEKPSSLIVMGDVFRTISEGEDEYAVMIKDFISAGLLVPDKEMLPCLTRALDRVGARHSLILDGTCRTLAQTRAQVLEILPQHVSKIITLVLECSDDVMRARLKKRARGDDILEHAVEERIRAFREAEPSVRAFLEQKTELRLIDANQDAIVVGIQVLKTINSIR